MPGVTDWTAYRNAAVNQRGRVVRRRRETNQGTTQHTQGLCG